MLCLLVDLQERSFANDVLSFPYVCPEPVLVKRSFYIKHKPLKVRLRSVSAQVDRSQYRSIISRVWQAWHSSLWQQAELDYIGNIEALENERLVLNHELHSTKATDKAALEAAALQFEALLASQGEECSCRLCFITGACVHTHSRHTWMFVFWSLCVFESCV